MSKTIYKYEVKVLDFTSVKGRIEKFLDVQYQHSTEKVCVWAIVDDKLPERTFIVGSYGTKHAIDPCFTADDYIGTVQLMNGSIVVHCFAAELGELRQRQNEKSEEISPEMEYEIG